MKHTAVFRAISVATISSLALVAAATGASAAPAEATLTIGDAGVLTLPASDGVRDTTSVLVTSDVGTNITLKAHLAGDSEGIIIGSAEVTDDAPTHTFVVPVSLLGAGDYDLIATPSAGNSITTKLIVGSGEARVVSLSLSAGTIYTWSKATPLSTTATVSAKDETGLTVPFSGPVTATVGGATASVSVTSSTGAAAKAKFDASQLKPGTGKVTAALTGNGVTKNAAATLKVLQTAVTGVTVKASEATVFPKKDGHKDTTKITVTPTTSTGKVLAATGKVTITRNGTTAKSWTLSSTKAWSGTWDGKVKGKIVPGTYTVKVGLKGPEGATKTTTTTIKVANTAVTGITVKASEATVFPAKDGHKDTTKITVTPKTSTGKVLAATGKVTITRNGTTAKSWTLSSTKAWSGTWDGKVKGKIVPGTYTVKVSLKGPEGATKTTSTKIKVDKAKLVTKTKTVTHKGADVMETYEAFSYSGLGDCYTDYVKLGDFFCEGYSAVDVISLLAFGSFSVPSDVVSAQKYGGATATVSMNVTDLYGGAAWTGATTQYGATKSGALSLGKNSLGALKLPATSKSIHIAVGLAEYSDVGADTITVVYTYKALQR